MINYCCQYLVLVLTPIPLISNNNKKVDQKGNGITLMGALHLLRNDPAGSCGV